MTKDTPFSDIRPLIMVIIHINSKIFRHFHQYLLAFSIMISVVRSYSIRCQSDLFPEADRIWRKNFRKSLRCYSSPSHSKIEGKSTLSNQYKNENAQVVPKRRVYIPKLTQQQSQLTPSFLHKIDSQENKQFHASNTYHSSASGLSSQYSNSKIGEGPTTFQFPTGELRDQRFQGIDASDMEITFLGTASCIPSVTRGVNAIALRHCSNVYLFDCGESTQVQVQKSSTKLSRIRKIFISHTHGDHIFGLPGILCILGSAGLQERAIGEESPIDIYGPEGIRHYIRASLQLTYSRIAAPHRIHELKNVPYLHGRYQRFNPTPASSIQTKPDPVFGERPGGEDIYPDDNGIYHLPSFDKDEELYFQAAAMQHSIPCVGYVATEKIKPRILKIEKVEKLVESQREELVQKYPFLEGKYRKIYAYLKSLQPNESFTFPNGQVVFGSEITDLPKPPRKIVIMGDTCNSNAIKSIAMNATVLVHEATNAFLPEFDQPKFQNYYEVEKDSFLHGHSTPQMAGRFAKAIHAKRLFLTHFSARYRGDSGYESMNIMWRIENMARRSAYPLLSKPNDVIAAWDLLSIPIHREEESMKDPQSYSIQPKTEDSIGHNREGLDNAEMISPAVTNSNLLNSTDEEKGESAEATVNRKRGRPKKSIDLQR